MTNEPLLRVSNLKTYFYKAQKTREFGADQVTIKAVDGVGFKVEEGKTLGLTGESGSGKTTVAMSILNLIPHLFKLEGLLFKHVVSSGKILEGEILYRGRDLLKLPEEEIRKVRGREIAMIFQNPIPALNPMEIIGFQVGEAVTAHEQTRREKLRQMVYEYLGKVELKDAKQRYRHDPHMFSGGEGQRIMVAMALISGPSLLIADEPTKSLDVIVQRQVLSLLQQMKKQFNLSMLLITHDLSIIAEMSDHVALMYSGKIVEYGDAVSIYKDPKHPYTQGLLASIPRIDMKKPLKGLPGEPPNPLVPIPGCKFHPRCRYATENCRREEPQLLEIKHGHLVACSRVHDIPQD